MTKLSIIICSRDNEEIIIDCLKSIKEQDYNDYEIILVDDGSKDETISVAKKVFPEIKVIVKEQPSGPAISKNLGEKKSVGRKILFLDSDIILQGHNVLSKIMIDEEHDIIGTTLRLTNGTIDSAGGGILRIGVGYDHKRVVHNKKVFYVPTAFLLTTKLLFQEVGGFDEEYFYGHEDTDFCWRAKLLGKNIGIIPLNVLHKKNVTITSLPKSVIFHGTKNRISSIIKNYSLVNTFFYLFVYGLFSSYDIILRGYPKEKIKAWLWNIKNIKKTTNKRKMIQKNRIVKDSELPFGKKII